MITMNEFTSSSLCSSWSMSDIEKNGTIISEINTFRLFIQNIQNISSVFKLNKYEWNVLCVSGCWLMSICAQQYKMVHF